MDYIDQFLKGEIALPSFIKQVMEVE